MAPLNLVKRLVRLVCRNACHACIERCYMLAGSFAGVDSAAAQFHGSDGRAPGAGLATTLMEQES